jgi:AbrB family looped-hinge helix DNA binding protein
MAKLSARRLSMETTLDRFGRIVIPKRVREDLNLRTGSVLKIEERDDQIVLSLRREEPDLVREGGVLVFTGEAVGDLEDAVEAQRRARSREAAAWKAE